MSQPDYRTLLDPEVWAYMERSARFYPPDAVNLSVAQQRRVYDAMCADFHQGRPDGVRTWDEAWGGVPCRRYEVGPSEVTVIYCHGGGFVVGGLDSHDDICAELCARTGFRLISVDYGLAPEVVFPACFNDGWSAFAAIGSEYAGPIVMSGDSAGGNLAAAVVHQARDRGSDRIVGQVLIYPDLGGNAGPACNVAHAHAPELTFADVQYYRSTRVGGAPLPVTDARFAPLRDRSFKGLPATVIVTAECDPLASDGGIYRAAIRAAGGQAEWFNEAGLVHGCLRARSMSSRAAAFFDRVADAISALGQRNWPYLD